MIWKIFILSIAVILISNVSLAKEKKEELKVKTKIEIAPGDYFCLKYDAKKDRFFEHSENPYRNRQNKRLKRLLKKIPDWLKEGFAKKIVELEKVPVKTPGNSVPVFYDFDKDGKKDLVVGSSDGKVYAYKFPFWKKDDEIFKNVKVNADAYPAFLDSDDDGNEDLILGSKDGKLFTYKGPKFDKKEEFLKNRKFGKNISLSAFDINKDGKKDIIIGNSEGGLKALLAPSWKEYKKALSHIKLKSTPRIKFFDINSDGVEDLLVTGEGRKILCYTGFRNIKRIHKIFSKKLKKLDDVKISPTDVPAFFDVTGDGVFDLVLGRKDGSVCFYKNRGTNREPVFLSFKTKHELLFPMETGYLPKPAFFDLNNDKRPDLVIGNRLGELLTYTAPSWKEFGSKLSKIKLESHASPLFCDLNNDGSPELLTGTKEGKLRLFFLHNLKEDKKILRGLKVEKYSIPACADVDGDGDLDIVVGSIDGKLTLFKNTGTNWKPRFVSAKKSPFSEIDVGHSSAPAFGDISGDGKPELIVGNQKGELKVFAGADWKRLKKVFEGVDVGEFATPAIADIDSDGKNDVVIGTLSGKIIFYKNESDKQKIQLTEKYSWQFKPKRRLKSIDDYYKIYFSDKKNLMGTNDTECKDAYMKLLEDVLEDADKKFIDEIAFTIINTPTEVLRTVARLNEVSIFLDNAKSIYDMSKKVNYVKIVEKGDFTTLKYFFKEGHTKLMPREIYYWWVVHPRILFEIPCKIDATWWDKPPELYGMDKKKWLRHKPKVDIHTPSPQGKFWRTILPTDRKYKKTLLNAVKSSKTLYEAVENLHKWLCWGFKGAFMTFGYITQDLQPLVIYKKHYGSCGEQSILAAACARAMLIPCSVVTDRGEDHQWNEFYFDAKWHHWDVNHKDGIDTPWSSTEGREHKGKTVSAVTCWRGDDYMKPTTTTVANPPKKKYTKTGAGYTDTGKVSVFVKDKNGKPVDGALILVRSHWNHRNAVTIWGYTDMAGRKDFELGYEPHGGYTFEILSPFGSAGTVNFFVEEGKKYKVDYILSGKKITLHRKVSSKIERPKETKKIIKVNFKILSGALYPPNITTSKRYRIGDYLTEKAGYRGTRKYREPIPKNNYIDFFVTDLKNFKRFKNGSNFKASFFRRKVGKLNIDIDARGEDRYIIFYNKDAVFAHQTVEITSSTFFKYSKPFITLAPDLPKRFKVKSGDKIKISGVVKDNVGIKKVCYSLSRGKKWIDIEQDFGDADLWEFEFDTGKGGPIPPGDYKILFRAEDLCGVRSDVISTTCKVLPNFHFKNQKIYQDDPETPLPKSSWIMGPFYIKEGTRFLDITATSTTEGFDMDMHLFFDKNGNAKLDGMREKLKASTSPVANERIYIDFPKSGIYWLYCQGWKVKGKFALLDVKVSFGYKPVIVIERSPSGFTNKRPKMIAAKLRSVSKIIKRSVKVKFNNKDVTNKIERTKNIIKFYLPKNLKKNREHKIEVRVKDRSGNVDRAKWSFTIDQTKPKVELFEVSKGKKRVVIKVKSTDNLKLRSVKIQVSNSKPRRMRRVKKKKDIFQIKLKELKGVKKIILTAQDAAGNVAKRVLRIGFN